MHKALPVTFHLLNLLYDACFTWEIDIHIIFKHCSLKIFLGLWNLLAGTRTNVTKTWHFHPPLFLRMKIFSLGKATSINTMNVHAWSHINPRRLQSHADQQRFSINVWSCRIGDKSKKPYVLPLLLNGIK